MSLSESHANQLSNREVELRAFDINAELVRQELETAGAVSLGRVAFKRAVIDVSPINPNRWIRVRTDGQTTTLAVKERIESGASGTGEHEVEVSDFDETLRILSLIGNYAPRSYQENYRDAYVLNGAEISIDTWPQLGNVLEIEAESTEAIYETAATLSINPESLTDITVEEEYLERYGIDVKVTPVRFSD